MKLRIQKKKKIVKFTIFIQKYLKSIFIADEHSTSLNFGVPVVSTSIFYYYSFFYCSYQST